MEASNVQDMREALELFVEYSELVCRMGIFNRDRLIAITTKARAALSLPRRNCDVGTAEEQVERFNRFCKSHPRGEDGFCRECPFIECYNEKQCLTAWAQTPYTAEKGGAE